MMGTLWKRQNKVFSDTDILDALGKGDIVIEPFESIALQPASVDLRLGNEFRFQRPYAMDRMLDVRQPVDEFFTHAQKFRDDQKVVIQPQDFVLAATREKISLANNVVGRLEGKSSLARIGISVHSTGGFIDPGNRDLRITLEIVNHGRFPIALYPGMWICQIAFQYTLSPAKNPYGPGRGSRYYGDSKPVLSRVSEKLD